MKNRKTSYVILLIITILVLMLAAFIIAPPVDLQPGDEVEVRCYDTRAKIEVTVYDGPGKRKQTTINIYCVEPSQADEVIIGGDISITPYMKTGGDISITPYMKADLR